MKFSEYIKQNSTNESNKKQSLKFSEWVNQYVAEQAQQEALAKAQSDYKYATTPIIPTADPTLRKLKGQDANTLEFNPIAPEGAPVDTDSGVRLVSREVYDAAKEEQERQNTTYRLKTEMNKAKTEWENARDSTVTEKVMNFVGGIEGKSDKEIAKEKYLSAAEAYYQNRYNTDADLTTIFNSLKLQSKDTEDETVKAELEQDADKISKLLYGNTAIDDYLGSNVLAGAGGISSGITATLDATAGKVLKLFGWEDNPISTWNESVQSSYNYWAQRGNSAGVAIGDSGNWGGRIIQALIGVIPDALLATMTRGSSLPTSGTLRAVAGAGVKASTANLVRQTATLEGKLSPIASIASKSKVVADAAGTALKTTVKNPMYWTSFTRTFGTDYEAAKEKGADEGTAYLYALVTSTMNSLVEVGGGIQVLPARLQNKSKSQILDWIKSALEEGGEEVVQSVISEMNEKLMYDYDKEIFSLTDEDAVINPGRIAGEFALGTAVGGIAGGGQVIASNASTAQYTKLGKSVRNSLNIQDLISYAQKSSNENIRTIATENTAEKISDKNLGILYGYAVRDVDAAFNSVSDIEGVNRVLGELTQENNSQTFNNIIFSRYVNRLDTIDPQTVSGYNNDANVNQDNGGSNDATYQQGKMVGSSIQSEKGNTGMDSQSQRSRREIQRDFIRRTVEAGRTSHRQIHKVENSYIAYTPLDADETQASKAVEIFKGLGINAIYCDGKTESNVEDVTTDHFEAVTSPDGVVFVSNTTDLSAVEIVAHEMVHIHQRRSSRAYIEYGTVIYEKMQWGSDEHLTIALEIFNNHHRAIEEEKINKDIADEKLRRSLTEEEIENIVCSLDYMPQFLREFTAYVNEAITANLENTIVRFSKVFSDWDAVVEASRRFNEAIGLDFSGADADTTTVPNEGADTDTQSDGESAGVRMIDLPAISVKVQNFVKSVGKALGRNVEFVNMEKFLEEHDINTEKLKIYPEGAIDGKGNIYLRYNAEKPVQFLFKHELTHFGERSKYYKTFVKVVRESKVYLEWLKKTTKTEGASREVMEAELMKRHREAQSSLTTLGYDGAMAEIIADFVGEKCFGESLEDMNKLVASVKDVKERNAIVRFLHDFFLWLKNKLVGIGAIKKEISVIEQNFARMIADADNTKTSTENGRGLKYSYAGNKALTANRSALTDAVVMKAKGIDDAVILERTGWFKGGDGKWRYNIPDNELKINARFLFSESMTLGDFVKHDKLFAAYPELENIKLRFEQRKKGKNGSYNHSNNEIVLNSLLRNDIDKLKDTLVHEMQHAIQHIEGFAEGGDKDLGLRIAFNYAYEQVKDTDEYKAISMPEKKEQYIFDTAAKLFGVKSIEDAAKIAYKNLYGEVEAREVANNRQLDENELRELKPDTTGNVVDKVSVIEDYIANLTEIGYTEEEIISRFGGNVNDQSGSAQDISGGQKNVERMDRLLSSDKSGRMSSIHEDRTDSQGTSGNMGRGVRSDVSDRRGRGTGSDIKFSVATAERTDTSTDFPTQQKELFEKLQSGEITQQEYMDGINSLWERAQEEYGTIPDGETVTEQNKPFPTPKSVKEGTKVRQHVRTILESGMATEGQEGILTEAILSGKLSYTPTSDEKRIKSAESNIEKLGYQIALDNWKRKNADIFTSDKNHVAEGEALLVLAFEHKNEADIVNLTAELAELGTRTAQNLQAMKLLKRMGGIAQLVYVQRCVAKINQDLEKRFKRRQEKRGIPVPVVTLDSTLAQQLAESKTEAEYEITYEAIMQDVAAQVPPTFLDKFNAWRYMAMLLNVTTHVRNFLGNAIFLPAIRIKNVLGKVMELTQDKDKRTKSVIVKKEYKDFARQDFDEVKDIIAGGGKYNPSDSIEQYRRIFKTKWLEAARKFNFDLLEKEDMIFLKAHYTHALGGYLQAQGISPESVSAEQLAKARAYAMQEALKATYRDASKMANVLSQLSHSSKAANVLIEGTMPFKKTPINIVKRGIEYSPVGLISTVGKGIDMLRGGEVTADQFIDGLAANLTGTGVFLLGMLLAGLGVAKGGFDDEEKWFRKLNGEQEYSIEIAGRSYTISWASPVCIPFFIGVAAMEYKADEDGDLLSCAADLALAGFEPLLELSCLSGINDLIEGVKYATSGASIPELVGNAAGSYLSQLLPTIGGKVANLFDDTRRTTYIDKTSDMPEIAQEALDKIASKTPFASQSRAEYIDAWGETQYTGNFVQRFFQQFVSPGYASTVNVDDVSEELMRLYRQTDVSGIFPSTPQKYFKIRGERRDLSQEEYFEYATFKGQTQADLVDEAIHSEEYAALTDEQKAEVIKDIYSYAGALAKCQLDYTYEEVAAMEGEDTRGNLILTEEKYNRLNDKARQLLIDEYFMEGSSNVKAYKVAKNGRSVVEYFCKKVKDN